MNIFRRWQRSWAWRCFPWTGARLKLGTGLLVPLRAKGDLRIITEIFIERDYAPQLEAVGELRTVVDLGCNTGAFTLFLHDWLRRAGRPDPAAMLLVDADPALVEATRATLAENRLDRCRVESGVIGPRGGTVDFFVRRDTAASSMFGGRGRRLRLASLDLEARLAAAVPGVIDLVKADVEGGEEFLLTDWLPALSRARWLLVEWHHFKTPWATARAQWEAAGWQVRSERTTDMGYLHALLANTRLAPR